VKAGPPDPSDSWRGESRGERARGAATLRVAAPLAPEHRLSAHSAGGSSTLSMMWITPLAVSMSAVVTTASFT